MRPAPWTATTSAPCSWPPGSVRCMRHALIFPPRAERAAGRTGPAVYLEHLCLERGHRTPTITRKDGAVITYSAHTANTRAIGLAATDCRGLGRQLCRHERRYPSAQRPDHCRRSGLGSLDEVVFRSVPRRCRRLRTPRLAA